MTKHTVADDRRYEMMFVLQPQATEAARTKLLAEVRGFVEETGAKIFHEDDWGRRDLAYRIKGYDMGYYHIFYFNGADAAKMAELEQNMRLEGDVVRHLIVKLPSDYEIVKYDLEDLKPPTKPAPDATKEPVDKKELDKKLDKIMLDDDLNV